MTGMNFQLDNLPLRRTVCSVSRPSACCALALTLFAASASRAQVTAAPEEKAASEVRQTGSSPEGGREEHKEVEGKQESKEVEEAEPATDLTVFIGSDFVRPGLLPRANLNVAIGHSFHFLKHDPLGSKLTFDYTYENTGTHGFFHTSFGEHTEQLGLLRDFKLRHSERFSAYTIVQAGISSLTGDKVQNRFSTSPGAGFIIHFSRSQSMWLQELYNKVVTVPWYTVSSVGYTYSF